MVGFSWRNDRGPRLSVGAADVETASFDCFDRRATPIRPGHIMVGSSLPPGFPPVLVEERSCWEGGLVCDTPLQFLMENPGADPVGNFQVELFSARDATPGMLTDVGRCEKGICFSSRARLTIDRYRQLYDLREAALRLATNVPAKLKNDSDPALPEVVGSACPIALGDLIRRNQIFEDGAKDYEFSRDSMARHRAGGVAQAGSRRMEIPQTCGRWPAAL